MSVSVSLGLLVPLPVRGYIRRESLAPYITGCNISTFVDTLTAGVLLRNPAAADIVLVRMISVLLVSIIILATAYRRFEGFALGAALWLNKDRRRLAGFLVAILALPLSMTLSW